MEYAVLNNGVKMPMEGFGVFQVPDSRQCEQPFWTPSRAATASSTQLPPISTKKPWVLP